MLINRQQHSSQNEKIFKLQNECLEKDRYINTIKSEFDNNKLFLNEYKNQISIHEKNIEIKLKETQNLKRENEFLNMEKISSRSKLESTIIEANSKIANLENK